CMCVCTYTHTSTQNHGKDRQGLGLSLAGNRDRSRLSIFVVVRGGVAELDGRLMQGDQILSVNGDDTRHASQETVAAILKNSYGNISLQVTRAFSTLGSEPQVGSPDMHTGSKEISGVLILVWI
uniref:PDZ domain-containing protein n=1 Tax=Monopterus albus TaxID=43700 RepID=A0A3Q3KIG6_MONAL